MNAQQGELVDGRKIAIDGDAFPHLSCGVICLESVRVFENPAVGEATQKLGDRLRQEYDGLLPSQIDDLAEARTLYKSFNMDPSRHRPSSEALLRRVVKGKDLYQINNAVDTCNLASLGFLLPVGMYDLDLIEGDVLLRAGRPGESYPGIRKAEVNLAHRLGLFDGLGPFGSPTSDSARTCVSDSTQKILAVIMATGQYPRSEMSDNLDTFANLFLAHCEARESCRYLLGGA